uniref:2,3-bisphosphoglycerate-independent phosphoglycerate mutase n=1 Tax=Laurencia obtusa TaxID=137763 RepID=UPI0028D8CC59|nr:2,3-bisphosphoglycerate-independent phosphoglycerate mutase [Laurencia obtusa]WMP12847.1 2,3-bisphosphoglycerate-independent phosphoglycerate mutase [Laurencia obtusa]
MHNQPICPIVLIILDGWGYSEKTTGNAIKLAKTPTIDKLWNTFPKSLLNASGKDVGLPEHQMGNSEVGHTTIGAGRTINQDLVRIQKSIDEQDFFSNKTIHNICQNITNRKSQLHLIGLCSDGGVHSHINHLKAMIQIVKKYKHKTYLHLITDGRDTEAKIAVKFLDDIQKEIKDYNNIHISTISGRYYSMDRDCRWSRTEQTYKILTENHNIQNEISYQQIIKNYYNNNISDEFIPPTRIHAGHICNNDGIIFFNFRPDRIRQLVQCLAKPNFKGFLTKKINNLMFATFTEYDPKLRLPTVFSVRNYTNFLGEIISQSNLKQLRLSETEKYAHVTYFFNGGIEEPFPGEDRELIPSPKVDTYDKKPEMSAHQITDSLINAIDKNLYKLIVVNYANPDMIGHTGNLEATIQAIEVVDKCINRLVKQIEKTGCSVIITADHGNADYMIDENNRECKSHSTNPVPFILISNENHKNYLLRQKGNLADIAPTILDLLKIKIPEEMNGKSLINNYKSSKLNQTS